MRMDEYIIIPPTLWHNQYSKAIQVFQYGGSLSYAHCNRWNELNGTFSLLNDNFAKGFPRITRKHCMYNIHWWTLLLYTTVKKWKWKKLNVGCKVWASWRTHTYEVNIFKLQCKYLIVLHICDIQDENGSDVCHFERRWRSSKTYRHAWRASTACSMKQACESRFIQLHHTYLQLMQGWREIIYNPMMMPLPKSFPQIYIYLKVRTHLVRLRLRLRLQQKLQKFRI